MSKAKDFLDNFNEEDITDMDRNYAKALGIKLPDDGWDLESAHKNRFTSKDGIENPSDGGGQGNDPKQSQNPFYQLITDSGFIYSHSTPVVVGEHRINFHTYKNPQGKTVSVHQRPKGWFWDFQNSSQGRVFRGSDEYGLMVRLTGRDPKKQAQAKAARQAKKEFETRLTDEGIAKLEGNSLEPWQARMVMVYFLGPDDTRLPKDYRWLGNIEVNGSKGKVMLYNDQYKGGYSIKIR